MTSYDTVYTGGSDEIVEKKSRFIAQVFPVEAEEEVLRIFPDTAGSQGRLVQRGGRFWRP